MVQYVITLANSVIGVSVLALPFCFQQCGIVLATLMLICSAVMTRIVCHFLLKAGTTSRRRTYELLAYHTYGPTGKLIAELTIIGFLLGTLIAFLVVMGDLGPQIVSEIFDIDNNNSLRTIVMTGLALFVALPLGLLKNIDSLGSVSIVTLMFYVILVCKILASGVGPLWAGSCLNHLNYWRPAGILQCIPIFAMALSCQTQIFPIYDSLPDPTLPKMNSIVRSAVHLCTCFYFCVGFFGYVAFCSEAVDGNILVNFKTTSSTQFIKCCFVFSIAFSVPLVVLPCRASLHSMIWRNSLTYHHLHETSSNYIPEGRLRLLTVAIIGSTLVIGLMIPNIELVLGLVGSTAGSVICIIFPALMFMAVTPKNTTEKIVARGIFVLGVIILVMTTYATLYAVEKANAGKEEPLAVVMSQQRFGAISPNSLLGAGVNVEQVEKLSPQLEFGGHENQNQRQKEPPERNQHQGEAVRIDTKLKEDVKSEVNAKKDIQQQQKVELPEKIPDNQQQQPDPQPEPVPKKEEPAGAVPASPQVKPAEKVEELVKNVQQQGQQAAPEVQAPQANVQPQVPQVVQTEQKPVPPPVPAQNPIPAKLPAPEASVQKVPPAPTQQPVPPVPADPAAGVQAPVPVPAASQDSKSPPKPEVPAAALPDVPAAPVIPPASLNQTQSQPQKPVGAPGAGLEGGAVAEQLLKRIEKQQEEQRKLIEEQKQVLEELKKHHEEHDQADVDVVDDDVPAHPAPAPVPQVQVPAAQDDSGAPKLKAKPKEEEVIVPPVKASAPGQSPQVQSQVKENEKMQVKERNPSLVPASPPKSQPAQPQQERKETKKVEDVDL